MVFHNPYHPNHPNLGPGNQNSRTCTTWTRYMDVIEQKCDPNQNEVHYVPMDDGSRHAGQVDLPCGKKHGMYFSIQPHADQNDQDYWEFPLDQPMFRRDAPLPFLIPDEQMWSANLWFGMVNEPALSLDISSYQALWFPTTGDKYQRCHHLSNPNTANHLPQPLNQVPDNWANNTNAATARFESNQCIPIHTHLHNDPHDNLYVLVKGKKRFRVYSADSVANLETVTPPRKVLADGYVEWEGATLNPNNLITLMTIKTIITLTYLIPY